MNKLIIVDESKNVSYRFTGPSKWNELTERELLAWAGLCLKKLPFDHLVKAAFIFLYKIPERLFFNVPDSQIVQFGSRLNFLFDKNELNRWVISHFKFKGKWYVGPADQLTNVSIDEYRRSEIYYQLYVKTSQVKYLRLLLATLYRPKRQGLVTDDIREHLTEFGIQERAKRFEGFRIKGITFGGLDAKVLEAVLLNYEGCRNYIVERFKPIFENKGGSKGGKNGIFDFQEVIDSVAGGPFGSADNTENTNLYRFLRHLVKQKEAYEELKAKSKK